MALLLNLKSSKQGRLNAEILGFDTGFDTLRIVSISFVYNSCVLTYQAQVGGMNLSPAGQQQRKLS